MHLFKALYSLYKGDRDETREIAGKLSGVFSSVIRQRAYVSTGTKLNPATYNIIGVFSAHVDSSDSSSISLEPVTSNSPSPAASPQGSPRGASSPSDSQAEELLRMARERFQQSTSPPRKAVRKLPSRIAIEDSPALVPDSPVQAHTIFCNETLKNETKNYYAQHRIS